jgi:hypothetical protein
MPKPNKQQRSFCYSSTNQCKGTKPVKLWVRWAAERLFYPRSQVNLTAKIEEPFRRKLTTNKTFQLLQLARMLVDSGKTPKLILSSLLRTYKDLPILKAAPQTADLLTSPVNYSKLKAISNRCNWSQRTTSRLAVKRSAVLAKRCPASFRISNACRK